jgi:hypothetical protein
MGRIALDILHGICEENGNGCLAALSYGDRISPGLAASNFSGPLFYIAETHFGQRFFKKYSPGNDSLVMINCGFNNYFPS